MWEDGGLAAPSYPISRQWPFSSVDHQGRLSDHPADRQGDQDHRHPTDLQGRQGEQGRLSDHQGD